MEPELKQHGGPGQPHLCRGQERRATQRPGALGHENPVILSRERPRVVDEGKTASLGENSPALVTAQLLIVNEKTWLLVLYISHVSLANVSLPCKLSCALVLAP